MVTSELARKDPTAKVHLWRGNHAGGCLQVVSSVRERGGVTTSRPGGFKVLCQVDLKGRKGVGWRGAGYLPTTLH